MTFKQSLAFTADFGGKVRSYLPEDPGCKPITTAIAKITFGTVNVKIGKLTVINYMKGYPEILPLALVTVNFVPLYKVYDYGKYMIPDVWVLGKYLTGCSVIQKIPYLGEILKTVCQYANNACPLSNILFMIGTGQVPEY